ncbi:MAG: ATP-binding protein [Burkholderiaceae bacterium]|nr:ATP-binding protein [Burkholderiaceae bacterium]
MYSKNRPTLYLMVGIPYSGKSTFIRNHPTLSALSVVDSDSLIEKRAQAEQTTYSAIFNREIEAALKYRDWHVQKLIRQQRSFIVDQTNLTRIARAHWVELAQKHHYRIVVFAFALPRDESQLLARRQQRADKVIPIEVLADMIQAFEDPNESEGFSSIVRVDGYA